MLVKLLQTVKAFTSINNTEEGIITLAKGVQPLNAFKLMVTTLYIFELYVIDEGITKFHGFGGLENPVTETLLLSKKLYITYSNV